MSDIEKDISRAVGNTDETKRILVNAKLSEHFDTEIVQGKLYNIVADVYDARYEYEGVMQVALFFDSYDVYREKMLFSKKKIHRKGSNEYTLSQENGDKVELSIERISILNPLTTYDLKVFVDKK